MLFSCAILKINLKCSKTKKTALRHIARTTGFYSICVCENYLQVSTVCPDSRFRHAGSVEILWAMCAKNIVRTCSVAFLFVFLQFVIPLADERRKGKYDRM